VNNLRGQELFEEQDREHTESERAVGEILTAQEECGEFTDLGGQLSAGDFALAVAAR